MFILYKIVKLTHMIQDCKINSYVCYQISDIRNKLSHISMEENLHLDDQEVDEIFNAIGDFVSCLETLHPHFLTPKKASDIKQNLDQV